MSNPHQMQIATNDQDLVDLKEWCNHRVLAKRKEIYVPGVIRPTELPNSVLVELDYPEGQQQLYHDIFASGRYDVISDASPSLSDIVIGTRVCVRTVIPDLPTHVFIEGIVAEILNNTKQFAIKIMGNTQDRRIVKRAELRLVLPPWWDELEDNLKVNTIQIPATSMGTIIKGTDSNRVMSILINKPPSVEISEPTIIYNNRSDGMNIIKTNPNNNRTTYVRYEAAPAALQLHQVLPTLQPHCDDYYRTTATSPFQSSTPTMGEMMTQSVVHQQQNELPSGMTIVPASPLNDETFRRHTSASIRNPYDDYDSDDELRSASFAMDGEEKYSGSSKRSSMQSRGSTSSLIEHGSLTPRSQPATPR